MVTDYFSDVRAPFAVERSEADTCLLRFERKGVLESTQGALFAYAYAKYIFYPTADIGVGEMSSVSALSTTQRLRKIANSNTFTYSRV